MTGTNIDLIKFTYGSTVVYIDTLSVKENYTNGITVINIPTTDDTPNISKLINLNKVEDRFTVNGFLSDGQYNSETYSTALTKKNGLKTMFAKGAVVTMTWEGVDYDVAIDKYEIAFNAKDDNYPLHSEEAVYDVTFSCVVGVDLI